MLNLFKIYLYFPCVLFFVLKISEQKVLSNQKIFHEYISLFGNISSPISSPEYNLTEIEAACPRTEFFYSFSPLHMKAVGLVKAILAGSKSHHDFINIAKALRDRDEIHPKVWFYALSGLTHENPNFHPFHKVSPVEAMPDLFINSGTLTKARQLQFDTKDTEEICVPLDETSGEDNEYENALWYFREDIMLNAHHWFWHLYNPLEPRIRPDRLGELFYFFHQYLLARYNTERFTNGMSQVSPLELEHGAPIEEGYYAHLRDEITGRIWSDRPPFTKLDDIVHPTSVLETGLPLTDVYVTKLGNFKAKILNGIKAGYVIAPNGRHIPITNAEGIDILGDVIQATNYSINPYLYGQRGFHNDGHILLGRAADSKFISKAAPGVMLDSGTAMRDPVFYRWHTLVNNVFVEHKKTLTPYTATEGDYPLLWLGITISKLSVITDKIVEGIPRVNTLHTFWNQKRFPLSRGLDFFKPHASTAVNICAKHLDHIDFAYHFSIERQPFVNAGRATIRIFLAPRFDENGDRMEMEHQRSYFFLVDMFRTNLDIGINKITRHSTESTLTAPWPQGLLAVEESTHINVISSRTLFCGCGYPHHLLIPKGTNLGVVFDLFVMVTNGEDDQIYEEVEKEKSSRSTCRAAPIHCGLPGRKYPDARPMGYPFDRELYTIVTKDSEERGVETIEEFIQGISNMASTQIAIIHDEIFQPEEKVT